MNIIVVSPRYGASVTGGAEAHLRDYAERLHARGHTVRVMTTCARDHYTWENVEPAGTTTVDGIEIERFPITEPRDVTAKQRLEFPLQGGLLLDGDAAEAWARTNGYSESLFDALPQRARDADAVIFAPYLLATTIFGVRRVPEKAIVMPCLHDESYARLPIVHDTLRSARGILFNTEAEARLATSLIDDLPQHRLVGSGFDAPAVDGAGPGRHGGVAYAGRLERGKNFHLLLAWMAFHNAGRAEPLPLDVMGRGPEPIPAAVQPWTTYHGFVSQEAKYRTLRDSLVTANLSVMESFSYLIMESWLVGTPVIVHAGCAVTSGHCAASGGGLWVSSAEEFSESLTLLGNDRSLRDRMGDAGRRYVSSRYSWPAVMSRLESALEEMTRQ